MLTIITESDNAGIYEEDVYLKCLNDFKYPDYNGLPKETLFTNTKIDRVKSILKQGLLINKSTQSEFEGEMIWSTLLPNQKGYGDVTVAFNLNNIDNYEKVNNEQYCIYQNIPVQNIIFFDLPVCASNNTSSPYRLSDILRLVKKHGKDKVISVTNKMNIQYIPIETVLEYI